MEVVQLLGPQGFWQLQVLRGVGGQGGRKCSALEGDGNQCWPIRASILIWRTPLTEKPGRPQSRVAKSRTRPMQPCMHRGRTHWGSSAPARAEREGGAAAWPSGTLVASVQGHGCLCHRSSGPIRAFFRASCSWPSEGLFGQSLSIAPPVQALRGLPCLGSFSVVRPIRHIEGPPDRVLLCSLAYQSLKGAPWVRSYSVVSPSGV